LFDKTDFPFSNLQIFKLIIMELLDRFLKYVSFDTTSDPDSIDTPSTAGQTALLRVLADELREMGAAEVEITAGGYLTATIPATTGREREPTIGFLAHVDTSPDAPGAGVRPQLTEHEGDVIITSDGTTLLGADDKAGVAVIMTAAEILLAGSDRNSPHGRIRLAFTCDEEIGRGTDNFDVKAFGADFAYTADGGAEGELEYENFNAAEALVSIRGRSIHPGDAKGRIINASRVAFEFDSQIPSDERPETTSGYQGFYHLTRLDGGVSSAEMEYILRDFERTGLERRKTTLTEIADRFNRKYGADTVCVTMSDQYYNMREVVERHPEIIARAESAMRAAGVTPRVKPIRGGTDGARLSFMGLPCPNIFTGGENFHSLAESVSLGAMKKATLTVVGIALKD
jgi:tripeptide aminopeptidase